MNSIRQYRPAFFEGFEDATVEFNTTDELLAIPFVNGFSKAENFHAFNLSDNALMAIYRGGREWWVIGFIKDPSSVELPKWDGGITEAIDENGNVLEFRRDEVAWTDCMYVKLRDGRLYLNKP